MINLKNFEPNIVKIDKNTTKGLIFITLDTSQLNKLMIMKVFTVQIRCICVLMMHIQKKKIGNKYLIFDDNVDQNKELLKDMEMFGMELKTKLKQ